MNSTPNPQLPNRFVRDHTPGMESKTLTVVAIMKAQPGKEAALKQELVALIAPTCKESGCINYHLHQDIEDPAKFVFHENWTSKAHLDAHLNSPHLQAFKSKANDLLAEPPQMILAEKIG
jgi:quinol monooxygenase YgiN